MWLLFGATSFKCQRNGITVSYNAWVFSCHLNNYLTLPFFTSERKIFIYLNLSKKIERKTHNHHVMNKEKENDNWIDNTKKQRQQREKTKWIVWVCVAFPFRLSCFIYTSRPLFYQIEYCCFFSRFFKNFISKGNCHIFDSKCVLWPFSLKWIWNEPNVQRKQKGEREKKPFPNKWNGWKRGEDEMDFERQQNLCCRNHLATAKDKAKWMRGRERDEGETQATN